MPLALYDLAADSVRRMLQLLLSWNLVHMHRCLDMVSSCLAAHALHLNILHLCRLIDS